jgi:hypothetical protein
MKSDHRRIDNALKAHGAILVRQSKHKIWRLPNGRLITVSRSISDRKGYQNVMGDLKRCMREVSV